MLAAWQQQINAATKCKKSGKHKYATLDGANAQRDRLNALTGNRGSTYWCRSCKSFHITRQRPPLGDKRSFLKGAPGV
jgi:hypothetical protein